MAVRTMEIIVFDDMYIEGTAAVNRSSNAATGRPSGTGVSITNVYTSYSGLRCECH